MDFKRRLGAAFVPFGAVVANSGWRRDQIGMRKVRFAARESHRQFRGGIYAAK